MDDAESGLELSTGVFGGITKDALLEYGDPLVVVSRLGVDVDGQCSILTRVVNLGELGTDTLQFLLLSSNFARASANVVSRSSG